MVFTRRQAGVKGIPTLPKLMLPFVMEVLLNKHNMAQEKGEVCTELHLEGRQKAGKMSASV